MDIEGRLQQLFPALPFQLLLSALTGCCVIVAMLLPSSDAGAQTIGPDFVDIYTVRNLGPVPGLSGSYGNVVILPEQPNTMYIGAPANSSSGKLHAIDLLRDSDGRIKGFSGQAAVVADAPFNTTGIVLDPVGRIAIAQWSNNNFAQVDLSIGSVVNQIALGPLGVASSVASVGFIPPGYPGQGGMRLSSYSGGQFYSVDHSFDDKGILSIASVTQVPGSTLPGGACGWVYAPLHWPEFSQPSMIVGEFSAGVIAVFEMDENGNPVISSRRVLVSGLPQVMGGALDPVDDAYLFPQRSGNQIWILQELGIFSDRFQSNP